MKTKKQILTLFQGMQRQLVDEFYGIIDVTVYCSRGKWDVTLRRTTFDENCKIDEQDKVQWDNYREGHTEEIEHENEVVLAAFKKKFNLK